MSLFFHKAKGLGALQLHQPGIHRVAFEGDRYRFKNIGAKFMGISERVRQRSGAKPFGFGRAFAQRLATARRTPAEKPAASQKAWPHMGSASRTRTLRFRAFCGAAFTASGSRRQTASAACFRANISTRTRDTARAVLGGAAPVSDETHLVDGADLI